MGFFHDLHAKAHRFGQKVEHEISVAHKFGHKVLGGVSKFGHKAVDMAQKVSTVAKAVGVGGKYTDKADSLVSGINKGLVGVDKADKALSKAHDSARQLKAHVRTGDLHQASTLLRDGAGKLHTAYGGGKSVMSQAQSALQKRR